MTEKKRVMIVDDHPFFIHGLERYLSATGKYEIKSALSVSEAMGHIYGFDPDLLVMDVSMAEGGGMAMLRQVKERLPVKTMFLTVQIDPEDTIEALKMGIDGIALKDRDPEEIVKTIDAPAAGLFVPPTLIRLDAIEDLQAEWFGPILHVATWQAGKLAETIRRVNAKGYGLTMGLHSRIARAGDVMEAEARVGNLYVNRSMIGAVVGSQPFGGEGLSGTGPKAGGPHYLYRFVAERSVSTDTTSAGGNATLLSLDEGGI